MSVRLVAASAGVPDPEPVARFWAQLLDRPAVADSRGWTLDGADGQLPLRFTTDRSMRLDVDRWHLHVNGDDPGSQERFVQRALALGATHLDVDQLPQEGHVVLADPSGAALCVLEDGNSFVAGCGPLGELANEGTRAVGVFWSRVLDWPLVWDEEGQTAIQSPSGGTKLAWGGPPVAPRTGPNRQRFELAVDRQHLADELDRLITLGARPIGAHPGGVYELADPDGNEFHLVLAGVPTHGT